MNQTDLCDPLEFVVENENKQLSFRLELCPRIDPRRADVPIARIKAPVEATVTSEVLPATTKVANHS